jgi:hypothetical protein
VAQGKYASAEVKEDDASEEDAADNEALQRGSHGLRDTAIWRLTDGPGARPEVAALTPVANRTAAGRLDFVLQVSHGTFSCPRGSVPRQQAHSPTQAFSTAFPFCAFSPAGCCMPMRLCADGASRCPAFH